jgi:hypothetical protein
MKVCRGEFFKNLEQGYAGMAYPLIHPNFQGQLVVIQPAIWKKSDGSYYDFGFQDIPSVFTKSAQRSPNGPRDLLKIR